MPPVLFPSLIQGGLSAIQLLTSLGINPQRPKYTVPQEVQDKLAQNQVNLNARSAGAARANENIFANQATTLQNATQAGGGISNQLLAGAMAQSNTNQALGDLSASEMEDYQRRLGNLGAAQSEMGQYRDKEFDINKMQPFQDAAAAKSALIQGGITNLFSASQGFAGLGQSEKQAALTQPSATAPQTTDPYSGLVRPFGQIPVRNMVKPVSPMTGGYLPQSVTTPFWIPKGNNLMFQNQDAYNSGVYQNSPWNVG